MHDKSASQNTAKHQPEWLLDLGKMRNCGGRKKKLTVYRTKKTCSRSPADTLKEGIKSRLLILKTKEADTEVIR
jgi:hypothetical protein